MRITVDHYGVHELASGIRFLAQGSGATLGLDLDVDLDLRVSTRIKCPHNIDLDRTAEGTLPDHPLVRVFLPLPKPSAQPIYLDDTPENQKLVRGLLRLGSPTLTGNPTLLWASVRQLDPFLTNILPLVASGYTFGVHQSLDRLTASAGVALRPLVILLPEWLASAQPGYIHTGRLAQALEGLPLEGIGAHCLRRYLRHEPLPDWAS